MSNSNSDAERSSLRSHARDSSPEGSTLDLGCSVPPSEAGLSRVSFSRPAACGLEAGKTVTCAYPCAPLRFVWPASCVRKALSFLTALVRAFTNEADCSALLVAFYHKSLPAPAPVLVFAMDGASFAVVRSAGSWLLPIRSAYEGIQEGSMMLS